MRTLIENFSEQLQHGLEISNNTNLQPSNKTFNTVLITGMGGSGIGGTIISELASEVTIPIIINKAYALPSWVNENTLVIGSTYSGNTEETISAVTAAAEKGAEIAFVTSGGKAGEMAEAHNLNTIKIPGGNPPRSMMAYSLVGMITMLNHYGVTNINIADEVVNTMNMLREERSHIESTSLEVAQKLQNKMPIIYAAEGFDGVATRLRQQINENSKMLCWHHIIPEMNHNELVGWAGGNSDMAVLILRNDIDSDKNQQRITINKEIIEKHTQNITEIWSKGDSLFERMVYHIHFGDWISLHLGELNGVDIVEVNVIDHLKSELAK